MTKPFEGQIALVTGASRGIGAATAEALAAAVEDRIHSAGGSATIAPLDLTEAESIGRLANAIGGRWEKLDILILNAGMLGTLGPVQYLDAKELAQILTLNVSAQASLIGAFDPLLRRSDDARIVGMTSSVGQAPRGYWGAYGASKAAFDTLLGAYADENRSSKRLKVAIIDPGATRTQMRAKAYPGEDPQSVKEPAEVAAAIVALLANGFETGHRQRIG